MYYRVDRTYLTKEAHQEERLRDRKPYLVPASSATDAALAFVLNEQAALIGPITAFPGDKATATAELGDRAYVIFIERAIDSLQRLD